MELTVVLMLLVTTFVSADPNERRPNVLEESKRKVFRLKNPSFKNVSFLDGAVGFNVPFNFPNGAIFNMSWNAGTEHAFDIRLCTDSSCTNMPYRVNFTEEDRTTQVVVSRMEGDVWNVRRKALTYSVIGKPLVVTIYRHNRWISLFLNNVDMNLRMDLPGKLDKVEHLDVIAPIETVKLTVIKKLPKCPKEGLLCEQRNNDSGSANHNPFSQETRQCAPFEQTQHGDRFQKPLCDKNLRCWTNHGENECSYHFFRKISLTDGDTVTVSGSAYRSFSIGFCNDGNCEGKEFNTRVEFENDRPAENYRINFETTTGTRSMKSITNRIGQTRPFVFEFHFHERHLKVYLPGIRKTATEWISFNRTNIQYISIGDVRLGSVLKNGEEML